MNRSPYRGGWKYIVVALVVVLLAEGWAICVLSANRLTVVNRSGQAIQWITIRVGKSPVRLENILPGDSVSARFSFESDDSFSVKAQLADGTRIGGGFGYVTHGMYGERASFVVERNGDIVFDQN